MAKRTIEKGYFGSLGMSDPLSSFTERTIRVAWDFSKKNVPENKTIPLMRIPRGFCIDRISVVQTAVADQDVNLTFGLGSDNSVQIGGTFALSDDSNALLRSNQAAKITTTTAKDTAGTGTVTISTPDSVFVSGDDVLCLIVPDGLTGDKIADGAFDLCVHGFETFAEASEVNPIDEEIYRQTLQVDDNVSGGQMPLD